MNRIIQLMAYIFLVVIFSSCNQENNVIESDSPRLENVVIHDEHRQDFSILDSINKIGGYKFIKYYPDGKKCNLYKGAYIMNKPIADSFLLAKLGNKLAMDVYDNNKAEGDCPWPKMTIAYIYNTRKDMKDNRPIAACEITPSTPTGDGYVNRMILYSYKILGRNYNPDSEKDADTLVKSIP